jgi:hypothetical protein
MKSETKVAAQERTVRQRRSAPVLGRSNVRVPSALGKRGLAGAAHARCARVHSSLYAFSECESKNGKSQADFGSKPRVARNELPWEFVARTLPTPTGLWLGLTIDAVTTLLGLSMSAAPLLRAAPNPARGGLFIDSPDPYPPIPFCFSAARRIAAQVSCTQDNRRAAEKQKGGYCSRIVSTNRSPLTGFGNSNAAESDGTESSAPGIRGGAGATRACCARGRAHPEAACPTELTL